jgi:hypothetical protein
LYGAAVSRATRLGAVTSAFFLPAIVVARLTVSGVALSYTTSPASSLLYLAIKLQLSATSFHCSPSDCSHVSEPSANASPSYEKMRGLVTLTMPLSDANSTISSQDWLFVTPTQFTLVYAAPYHHTRSSMAWLSALIVNGTDSVVYCPATGNCARLKSTLAITLSAVLSLTSSRTTVALSGAVLLSMLRRNSAVLGPAGTVVS